MDYGSQKFLDAAKKSATAIAQAGKTAVEKAAGIQQMEAVKPQFMPWKNPLITGKLSTGGLSTGGLGGGAYNQSPLIGSRERRRYENQAYANGAISRDDRATSASGYNVTRSGDRRRARNVAVQKERDKEKAIATNIERTADATEATAAALGQKNGGAGN